MEVQYRDASPLCSYDLQSFQFSWTVTVCHSWADTVENAQGFVRGHDSPSQNCFANRWSRFSLSPGLLDCSFRARPGEDVVSGKPSGTDVSSKRKCWKSTQAQNRVQYVVAKQKSNLDVMKCTRAVKRGVLGLSCICQLKSKKRFWVAAAFSSAPQSDVSLVICNRTRLHSVKWELSFHCVSSKDEVIFLSGHHIFS